MWVRDGFDIHYSGVFCFVGYTSSPVITRLPKFTVIFTLYVSVLEKLDIFPFLTVVLVECLCLPFISPKSCDRNELFWRYAPLLLQWILCAMISYTGEWTSCSYHSVIPFRIIYAVKNICNYVLFSSARYSCLAPEFKYSAIENIKMTGQDITKDPANI